MDTLKLIRDIGIAIVSVILLVVIVVLREL